MQFKKHTHLLLDRALFLLVYDKNWDVNDISKLLGIPTSAIKRWRDDRRTDAPYEEVDKRNEKLQQASNSRLSP